MKWSIPAFALGLVVFLLLFTVIDRRGDRPAGAPPPRADGTAAPDIAAVEPAAERTDRLAATAPEVSASTAAIERVETAPPPLSAELAMTPTERVAFEKRLEVELLPTVRAAWVDVRRFSRAQVGPRVSIAAIVRVEVPEPYASLASAAFRVRPASVGRETALSPATTDRLLLVRRRATAEPLFLLEGGAGSPATWRSVPEFFGGRSRASRVESLPEAPAGLVHRRARGTRVEEIVAEQLVAPLEERREALEFRALVSRVAPMATSFMITRRGEEEIEHPGADGELVLTLPEPGEVGTRVVPLRHELARDRIEVFHAGEWVEAAWWAKRIAVEVQLSPEDPAETEMSETNWVWEPRWVLEELATEG